jgi:hypothetical protein
MCESDPAGASRRYENPRDAYQLQQAGIAVRERIVRPALLEM